MEGYLEDYDIHLIL